jgi:hypothetical protein
LTRVLVGDIQITQGSELNQLLARTAKLELIYCVLMSFVLIGTRWLA